MKREIWRDIPIVVQQYFACDLHLKNVLSAPLQKLIWQSMTSTIFTCNVFFFFFLQELLADSAGADQPHGISVGGALGTSG